MIYVVENSTLEPYESYSSYQLFTNKHKAWQAYRNFVENTTTDTNLCDGFGWRVRLVEHEEGGWGYAGKTLVRTDVVGHGKNMNYYG